MFEQRFTSLESWIAAVSRPAALMELAALLLCGVAAWAIAAMVRRTLASRDKRSILFGKNIVDGVLFPILLLLLVYLARILLLGWIPLAMFKIAVPILIALLFIRLVVKVLQEAFQQTPLVRLLERSSSWIAWLAMLLWVSGLLPVIMEELDQITWKMGGATMSVRSLIEGTLTAGAVLIITLWISSAIEARLLGSATGGSLSLRKALSNATRVLLLFVGLMIGLSAAGFNLSALSVLGGAIGVGIGFGLQKLAANYISGFVILAERSMRIGDTVRVDNFEGVITQINARYTLVRALSGRESIVPNEMLITSRVENLSLDARVWQSIVLSVGYDSDVELVMRVLRQASLNHQRVLRDPEPSAALSNFGPDGLEFTLGYWISDPENGALNLKSLINLDILKSLRDNHIEIPYPQRVMHTRTA